MTRSLSIVLAAVLAIAVGACEGEDTGIPPADVSGPQPDWIEEIRPIPGADAAVSEGIEVRYDPQGPNREVRLIVDGVDVTSYAVFDQGYLRYDPDQGPVPLGGQTHEAEVQLTERPTPDAIEYTVVDSFSWTFRAS